MESLLTSAVQLNLNSAQTSNSGLQLVNMSRDLMSVLKQSNQGLLKITTLGDSASTQLEISGNTYDVAVKGTLPHPAEGESISIPVQLNLEGYVKIITEQPSSQEQNIPIVNIEVNTSDKLQQLSVESIKLRDIIGQKLDELNVSLELRQQIIQQIPDLQVALLALGPSGNDIKAVLQSIYQTLNKIAIAVDNGSSITDLQEQLQQNILELVGQKIDGCVSSQLNDITFLQTDLGSSYIDAPLKLSPQEILTLNIVGLNAAKSPLPDNLVGRILLLFGVSESDIISFMNRNSVQIDKGVLSNLLAAKLPGYNQNFLVNIISFYQAAIHKNIALWLGADNLSQLTAIKPEATQLITELNNFIATSVKDAPLWRIIEIPVYADNNINLIKLALRKDKENDSSQSPSQDETRFILETTFSRLGKFQFDGLVRSSLRHMDLIVRTSTPLDNDFCAQIMNLFRNSLYNLDYKGNIKINQKADFINFYEATPRKPGIYV